MIDLEKVTERAAAAFPEKDPERLRSEIVRLVHEVREASIGRGDFVFHSTYGIHVQKTWHENEPEPDAVEVFLKAGGDYDILEEDLL